MTIGARVRLLRDPESAPAAPRAALRIAARGPALGDDAPEAAAVCRDEPVEGVEQRRGVRGAQQPREAASRRQLGEEGERAAAIARDGRAVTADEPPALAALLLRDLTEQARGFLVGERQQRQVAATVDSGDATRRPATEPSGPRIEQHRAPKRRVRCLGRELGRGHRPSTVTLDGHLFKR
jgi:hypothetical protein